MAIPISTLAPVLMSCPVLAIVRVSNVGGFSFHFPLGGKGDLEVAGLLEVGEVPAVVGSL